jgi:hypothetical protein
VSGPPAPPAATPGQAAHAAWCKIRFPELSAKRDPAVPWHEFTDTQRAAWDAAAAAVMLMAQATVDYAELQELRAELQEIHDALAAAWPGKDLTEGAEALLVAALIAERDKAREQLAATQAIARMLQATAIEILAAYTSGTVVSDELLGIWRERLDAP